MGKIKTRLFKNRENAVTFKKGVVAGGGTGVVAKHFKAKSNKTHRVSFKKKC